MELMPQDIATTIPVLYSQDGLGDDATIHVKFFTPDSNWTWFVTEFDPVERVCFGLVDGFEEELGYFSLDELESVTGPLGLAIERDLYFHQRTIKEVRKG